jgi:hypothetical protein
MIVHQIEALRDAGVTEVVLAINYQPAVMYAFINEYESKLGVKITISQVRLRTAPTCRCPPQRRPCRGRAGQPRLPRPNERDSCASKASAARAASTAWQGPHALQL